MDRIAKEGAFFVLQKVKLAVAIAVIKSTPSNEDVKTRARQIQLRLRKNAKRLNLSLEKKIFFEQLLVLYSAFRTTEVQPACDWEAMDVDVDVDRAPDDVQSLTNSNSTASLTSTVRFLDAVMSVKLLHDADRNVSRQEISLVLSKLNEFQYSCCSYETADSRSQYSTLSNHVLKYFLKSISIEKIVKQCVLNIAEHLITILSDLTNKMHFNPGFMSIISYACSTLLLSYENYPNLTRDVVFSFVERSLQNWFLFDENNFQFWDIVFECWKNNGDVCYCILSSLFAVAKNSSEVISQNTDCSLFKFENINPLLRVLKRMLVIHYRYRLNHEIEQNRFGQPDYESWETILKDIVVVYAMKIPTAAHLCWNCLQVIMVLKCKLKNIVSIQNTQI